MTMPARATTDATGEDLPTWVVIVVSAVSLGIAMGIGRFAFTPILPMMIADGLLGIPLGSSLATSNYIGYLAGAMLCMSLPKTWSSATLVRQGLLCTVVLTAGMIVPHEPLWLLLRFLSGVASAIAFVHTTRWCLTILGQRGKAAAGSAIFAGVGFGIALPGFFVTAMVNLNGHSAWAWMGFAALGTVLLGLIWRSFHKDPAMPITAPTLTVPPPGPGNKGEMTLSAMAYKLAGFGYIITATFLPVIARQALPPSIWLDLFWPAFGLAAVAGSVLVTRARRMQDARRTLTVCYVVQATGIMTSVVWPTVPGFLIGSVLAGLPFTSITYLALNEVRRLRPDHVARYMALLTALYGFGQIAGPPVANAIVLSSPNAQLGFDRSLLIASSALLAGAGLYLFMTLRWPTGRTTT